MGTIAHLMMIVPPIPISPLVVTLQLPVVAMRVVVGFNCPSVVVDALIGVPYVIVGVIRVICPITHANRTPSDRQRRK